MASCHQVCIRCCDFVLSLSLKTLFVAARMSCLNQALRLKHSCWHASLGAAQDMRKEGLHFQRGSCDTHPSLGPLVTSSDTQMVCCLRHRSNVMKCLQLKPKSGIVHACKASGLLVAIHEQQKTTQSRRTSCWCHLHKCRGMSIQS